MLLPSRPRAERVARLVPHDNASRDAAADLALLRLRAPVDLSAAPRPVCLPRPEHYFLPGSRCRLALWGRGGEQGARARPDGAGRDPSAARAPSLLPCRARGRPPRTARGRAVERLVVSLPVRPPGGAGAAAGRPAARAVPRLPGGGGGGPLLGE